LIRWHTLGETPERKRRCESLFDLEIENKRNHGWTELLNSDGKDIMGWIVG
jgi:hypothetical protein